MRFLTKLNFIQPGGVFLLWQSSQVKTFYLVMTSFLLHVRSRAGSTWAFLYTFTFVICTRSERVTPASTHRLHIEIKMKFGKFRKCRYHWKVSMFLPVWSLSADKTVWSTVCDCIGDRAWCVCFYPVFIKFGVSLKGADCRGATTWRQKKLTMWSGII